MTRILQISDPHLLVEPGTLSGQVLPAKNFEAAIDAIIEHLDKIYPVSAIVVTGDISDDGHADSYKLFRTQINRLNLPYFVIPGNHDHRETMRTCFSDLPTMPSGGKINWRHDFEGFVLVGLDTLICGEGKGVLGVQSLAFLKNIVAGEVVKPILIAMHHPPFSSGIQFMDQIGLGDAGSLAEILGDAKVETRIICGHVHNMIVGMVGNTIAISAPSTASTFPADYRDDAPVGFTTNIGGYMLHEFSNGFRSTSIDLACRTGPHPFY